MTTLTISTHERHQPGLVTTHARHNATTRAGMEAELRALHARRVPDLHSASLTSADERTSVSLHQEGGQWVLTSRAYRARTRTAVLA